MVWQCWVAITSYVYIKMLRVKSGSIYRDHLQQLKVRKQVGKQVGKHAVH